MAGDLFLSLHRKFFLLVFSISGLVASVVWFSNGDQLDGTLRLWASSVFFLFFLASTWAIVQYNSLRVFSILFSSVLLLVAVYALVAYSGNIVALALFLCSPVLFFFIGGASASLFFCLGTLVVACVAVYSTGVVGQMLSIGLVLFVFFLQVAGIFFLVAVSYVHGAKLLKTRKQLRKVLDEYRVKETYMAGLSHRIRTPLSSIIGVADLMKSHELTELQQEMVEAIVTSANNLLTLSDEIMQQAHIPQEGENEKKKNEFDIVKVLDDFVDAKNSEQKGIDFQLKVNYSQYLPKSLSGESDSLLYTLETILASVMSKELSAGLHCDIYIYDQKETVSSLELLVEVHLPVFHAVQDDRLIWGDDSSFDDKECLLLKRMGLVEISDHVTSKGGTFKVRHTSAAQTIVSFSLLYWKRDSDKMIVDKIQQAIKAAEHKNKKIMDNAVILIVEDNLMNQKVVSMALRNKVRRVDIANNGKEAVMMFSNSRYDLILMDLMMPVIDGHKATEKIRELESGTEMHTPIIALTANARSGIKETCLSSGMDDYLTKPFKFDELIAKVEEYLLAVK